MAVASFQPPAVVYREEQSFDWRVYALIALIEACVILTLIWVSQRGHAPAIGGNRRELVLAVFAVLGLFVPLLVAAGLLRMTTEVTPTDVRVWFGFVPTYRRFIGISEIQKIEVVSYRPIRDYGGWGVRSGRDGERVLNARGNRGVRLDLSDGSRILIGSQRPEVLAVAIERAIRPGC